MHASGSVFSLWAKLRPGPGFPPGSVLAPGDRRPDALATIGRGRILFNPGVPLEPAEEHRDPLPLAHERDAVGAGAVPRHSGAADQDCDPASGHQGTDHPGTGHQGIAAPLHITTPHHDVVTVPRLGGNGSAVSWALLSQVFWLPLVAVDLHDRWVAHQRDLTPPGQPLPPSPIASATSFGLQDLLSAGRSGRPLGGQAPDRVGRALEPTRWEASSGFGLRLSSAGGRSTALLDRPLSLSLESAIPVSAAPHSAVRFAVAPATGLLGRAFTPAQLLGGSIGLPDLQEGPMAPLALVERALVEGALQHRSGDPLAPLPSLWREPMRQALLRLPGAPLQLSTARLVTVPSHTVSQPVQVPLALQSDGSVDVLQPPADPAVLRDIEGWSRLQSRPATGSLQPALVLLHPLPSVAPIPPDVFASGAPIRAASDRAVSDRGAADTGSSAGGRSVSAPTAASPRRSADPPPATSRVQAQPRATTSRAVPVPLLQESPAPAATTAAATVSAGTVSVGTAAPIPVPLRSEAPVPGAPAATPEAPAVEAPVAPAL